MHFHGPIVRPQTDADSVYIEVTVGCTHNSCTFCNFYDGYPFYVAPMEQIRADIQEARESYPRARRIWLNGGNPYAVATDKLIEIASLTREAFPNARVSTYARVDDLTRKSVEEMKAIREAGLDDLVIGFETGDDEALAYVNKGYTAKDIVDGCRKLEAAGMTYRLIFLGGLSGRGKGEAAAKKTADVLNQLHPTILYLNSVSILPGTPLYEDREKGIFQEAGERENVHEFITMLSLLKNDIAVFAAPNTTPFSFYVDLQPNKKKLLDAMQAYADSLDEREEARIAKERSEGRSV